MPVLLNHKKGTVKRICHECETEGPTGKNIAEADDLAVNSGWLKNNHGVVTHCPDCQLSHSMMIDEPLL